MKTAFKIIRKILSSFLFLITIAVLVFTIFMGTTSDDNDKSLFGVRFLAVQSSSMSKSGNGADESIHFDKGDVIIIKAVESVQEISEGDVITFTSLNKESYGKTITHKVRQVHLNATGQVLGYTTYGINTNSNDEVMVLPETIIGEYVGKIPQAGDFFAFIRTPQGYYLSILLPGLLLLVYFSVKLGKGYEKQKVKELEKTVEELRDELNRVGGVGNYVHSSENETYRLLYGWAEPEKQDNADLKKKNKKKHS